VSGPHPVLDRPNTAVETHPSRLFPGSEATTPSLVVVTAVVSDSRSPFDAEEDRVVATHDDRSVVAPTEVEPE